MAQYNKNDRQMLGNNQSQFEVMMLADKDLAAKVRKEEFEKGNHD